jgi:hypothetical protein
MANEVANPFGASTALANRQEMAKKAAESSQRGSRGGAPDSSDYMNFSGKRGIYSIGKDKRVVQPDEMWVLNVGSFEDGFVCWKGGKPVSTRMSNIYTGVPIQEPDPEEGGPFNSNAGEGWHAAKGWVAKSIDTDDQGYFKVNSVSGVGEMASMIEECSSRMAVGKPCWPAFHYDMEEFEAGGYKNFKPIFTVYGWLDDEALGKIADDEFDIDELIAQSGVSSLVDGDGAAKGEAKPKAAKKQEAKEEAPAEPTRSRRRRSAA